MTMQWQKIGLQLTSICAFFTLACSSLRPASIGSACFEFPDYKIESTAKEKPTILRVSDMELISLLSLEGRSSEPSCKTKDICSVVQSAKIFRAGHQHQCSLLSDEDTDFSTRTFRLVEIVGGRSQSIGTVSAIGETKLATARHCLYDSLTQEPLIDRLRVRGQRVTLSSEDEELDIAVLETAATVCADPFVSIKSADLCHGMKPFSLSFPQMRDEELTDQHAGGPPVCMDPATPVKYDPAACPMLTEGRLACPAAGYVAMGTYSGFPNSSGGAVLADSKHLLGVHTNAAYHRVWPPVLEPEETLALKTTKRTKPQLELAVNTLADQMDNIHLNALQEGSCSLFVTTDALALMEAEKLVASAKPIFSRKRAANQLAECNAKRHSARRLLQSKQQESKNGFWRKTLQCCKKSDCSE